MLLNINVEKTLPGELCLQVEFFINFCTKPSHLSYFLMIYHIFYVLQENRLQLMATSLLLVFKYFQNEATSNRTDPKCGQLQPKKRLDQGSVQFGPMAFFGPMDWTFKH
jgi:hypothetical protein